MPRTDGDRTLLCDLDTAIQRLAKASPGNPIGVQLTGVYHNLLRRWAENHALRDELTAINQYFLHAEMSENWGYKKYSKYIKKQSIDEMKHAEKLMERILFLDGMPTMEPMSLTIGKSVKEMIESDLDLEHGAVASYNESIRICVENGDNGPRDLFVRLLRDEEGHADWLEAQVHQIKEMGFERYLTTQTEED